MVHLVHQVQLEERVQKVTLAETAALVKTAKLVHRLGFQVHLLFKIIFSAAVTMSRDLLVH